MRRRLAGIHGPCDSRWLAGCRLGWWRACTDRGHGDGTARLGIAVAAASASALIPAPAALSPAAVSPAAVFPAAVELLCAWVALGKLRPAAQNGLGVEELGRRAGRGFGRLGLRRHLGELVEDGLGSEPRREPEPLVVGEQPQNVEKAVAALQVHKVGKRRHVLEHIQQPRHDRRNGQPVWRLKRETVGRRRGRERGWERG